MDNIVEQLRGFAVPTNTLAFDPKNARKHSERNLEAIMESLRRFGQRMPIVVQKQGMVVRAGNGRLTAARKLGWTQIAAVIVDEKDADAAAFALADNRTAELAEWDWQMLAEVLDDIKVDAPEFDPILLGWNEAELEGLDLASAWDDVEADRLAAAGDRTRVNRSHLVLKFTQEQQNEIQKVLFRKGLGEEVTAEAVFDALIS